MLTSAQQRMIATMLSATISIRRGGRDCTVAKINGPHEGDEVHIIFTHVRTHIVPFKLKLRHRIGFALIDDGSSPPLYSRNRVKWSRGRYCWEEFSFLSSFELACQLVGYRTRKTFVYFNVFLELNPTLYILVADKRVSLLRIYCEVFKLRANENYFQDVRTTQRQTYPTLTLTSLDGLCVCWCVRSLRFVAVFFLKRLIAWIHNRNLSFTGAVNA